MKEARYGRMRVGRCQPRDYFVGCSADVTSIMHARCSGHQNCSIPIPDPDMFAATPCNKDLVSYLEADYECVKVSKSNSNNCDDKIHTDLNGYISQSTIMDMNTKYVCPQHIVAKPGQNINIYLYDFTNKLTDIEAKFYQPECATYGYVSEDMADTPFVKICGGEIKINQLIYSSKSNLVDISLVANNTHNYLLRYEVIGCPTLQAPQNSQLKIEGDTATITCDYSTTVTTLVCSNNQWIGDLHNCSTSAGPITGFLLAQSFSNIIANSSFTVMCTALSLSVLCSVVFLILALTYLNNQRNKKQQIIDIPSTSQFENPADYNTNLCIDEPVKAVDQYQSVYVPIKVDTRGQYVPLHPSPANTLSTFQSCVNFPTLTDFATTLENHFPIKENNYGQVRPLRDCGHSTYDLFVPHMPTRQQKMITFDNIV